MEIAYEQKISRFYFSIVVITIILVITIIFTYKYITNPNMGVSSLQNILLLLDSYFFFILAISYVYMIATLNNMKKYDLLLKSDVKPILDFCNPLEGYMIADTKEQYVFKEINGSVIYIKKENVLMLTLKAR